MGSGLWDIDLPLQKERTTGLPCVQASGYKRGAASFLYRAGGRLPKGKKLFSVLKPKEGHQHAGALALSDVRLLLFSRAFLSGGTGFWIASPFSLPGCSEMGNALALGQIPPQMPD